LPSARAHGDALSQQTRGRRYRAEPAIAYRKPAGLRTEEYSAPKRGVHARLLPARAEHLQPDQRPMRAHGVAATGSGQEAGPPRLPFETKAPAHRTVRRILFG